MSGHGCARTHAVATCDGVASELVGDRDHLARDRVDPLARAAVAAWLVRVGEVLAGQCAALEDPPGRRGEVETRRHGEELALGGAVRERVGELHRDGTGPAALVRHGHGLGDDPRRRVRQGDVQHLPRGDEIVEPAQHLLDGRHAVPHVQPEQVDVVGPEPAEARLERLHEVLALVAARVRVVAALRQRVLRRDDEPLTILADELADEPLAFAVRVVAGGIDEVSARLDKGVEDRAGSPPSRLPSPRSRRTSSCRGRAPRRGARFGRAACNASLLRSFEVGLEQRGALRQRLAAQRVPGLPGDVGDRRARRCAARAGGRAPWTSRARGARSARATSLGPTPAGAGCEGASRPRAPCRRRRAGRAERRP